MKCIIITKGTNRVVFTQVTEHDWIEEIMKNYNGAYFEVISVCKYVEDAERFIPMYKEAGCDVREFDKDELRTC